jgi:hypothetical protein
MPVSEDGAAAQRPAEACQVQGKESEPNYGVGSFQLTVGSEDKRCHADDRRRLPGT